jgi:hypothetical protein
MADICDDHCQDHPAQQHQQQSQPSLLFLPFARFEPLNHSEELPLSVGRSVLVLNREESHAWWYGRDLEDGREASRRFGPVVCDSIDYLFF